MYVWRHTIGKYPNDMLFEFKCLQFQMRLAFAMTINKAHGESLQVCGLNLENPCYSHPAALCGLLTHRKVFRFIRLRTRWKNEKYWVSHSTSINVHILKPLHFKVYLIFFFFYEQNQWNYQINYPRHIFLLQERSLDW